MSDIHTHHDIATRRRTPPPPTKQPEWRLGFPKRPANFVERALREHEWRKSEDHPGVSKQYSATPTLPVSDKAIRMLTYLLSFLNADAIKDKSRPDCRLISWPSNDCIAREIKTTTRSVQRTISELEEKGYLMRHYNQKNERIGFDLTGYVSQIEDILEGRDRDREDVRAAREAERMRSLDLFDLPDECQVRRRTDPAPVAAKPAIPPSENPVNQPRQYTDHAHAGIYQLGLQWFSIADLSRMAGDASPAETDSDKIAASAILRVTRMMTGVNGHPNKPWANALALMGPIAATTLYYMAVIDPVRRKTPPAYFAWLISQIPTPGGPRLIGELTERIADLKQPKPPLADPKFQLSSLPRRKPDLQYRPDPNHEDNRAGEMNRNIDSYNKSERQLLGLIHESLPTMIALNIAHMRQLFIGETIVVLEVATSFSADYLERNYKTQMNQIATEYCGRPMDVIVRVWEEIPLDFKPHLPKKSDKMSKRYAKGEQPGAKYSKALKEPASAPPPWQAPPKDGYNPVKLPRRPEGSPPGQLMLNGLPIDIPVPGSKAAHPQPQGQTATETAIKTPPLLPAARKTDLIAAIDDPDIAAIIADTEIEVGKNEIVLRFTAPEIARTFKGIDDVAQAARKTLGEDTITHLGWR